ncbi:MAG: CheR family methyltransferase [bacterium]
MTIDLPLSRKEFKLLRDYIQESCGILIGDEKHYLIQSRLSDLARANDCTSFRDFYHKAKNAISYELRDSIVDAMTTNETLWFRDGKPFSIISDKILPEYQEHVVGGTRNKIRIWSAGCSTGQEPYSIVITILEYIKHHPILQPEMFEIIATDISPSALAKAIEGKYDTLAISRGVPLVILNRYFENNDNIYYIKEVVKNMVTYKKFNLKDSFISLGHFDIIMFRYVAIYFSYNFKKELFNKIAKALTPGGYLFLGAPASISEYNNDFETLEYKRGLYFRIKK